MTMHELALTTCAVLATGCLVTISVNTVRQRRAVVAIYRIIYERHYGECPEDEHND